MVKLNIDILFICIAAFTISGMKGKFKMANVLMVIMFIVVIFDLCLVLYAASRPDRNKAIYFSCLVTAVFIYSLGYLLEISNSSYDGISTALKVQNFAIPVIAPLFLLTAVSLFENRKVPRWMITAVFIYGISMFTIVLLNSRHNLYYSSIDLVYIGGGVFAKIGKGPFYYVQQAIAFLCVVYTYIIIIQHFVKGNAKLRKQMVLFIIGSAVAFSANILQFFSLLPAGIDLTPVSLSVGLAIFAISLFKDNLLDVVLKSFNTAVENMADSLIVLDNDGDFLYCNKSAKQVFPGIENFTGTEAMASLENWPVELCSLLEEKHLSFEHRYNDRNNNEIVKYYTADVQEIMNSNNVSKGWSVIVKDMTDITNLIKSLEEMAITDPLTGVLNRRHFMVKAHTEISRARRNNDICALILYDIDFFKKVNDTYGHLAGDKILCNVAQTVNNALREYDLMGRLGGEEFFILASGMKSESMYVFADRLRETVEALETVYDEQVIKVTASFGVVEISDNMDMEEAIYFADMAMYEAKTKGRNEVVVSGGFDEKR